MKSKTKRRLSEAQIKELVKIKFGDDCRVGRITEQKGGVFSTAYLIERPNEKDKIILKVNVLPGTKTLTYEQDLMPGEVKILRLIAEKTSIPVPRILNYDFSKKYIPGNYFFMTAPEGEAVNKLKKVMSKENIEDIKKELAKYMAQLHLIRGEYFGYITNRKDFQFRTWKEAYLNMMRTLLQDGREHGFKLPYDRLERVLKEKSGYLEDVKEPSLVDFDLWTGNTFLKKDGNRYVIERIINFERAFWGDPMADLSSAFMQLRNRHKEERFWNTDKVISGFNRELTREDVRLILCNLYIFTTRMIETFRYGFLYGQIQKAYLKRLVMKYLRILERV